MLKLKVLGGGGEVGRVGLLFEDREKFLLDYGVNFDEHDQPQMPMHVRPIDLKFVVISHAHLDHIGAAPLLYITGNPPVVATRPTLDVARVLVHDFLKLNGPLVDYEYAEFEKLAEAAMTPDYGEEVELDGHKVVLMNAGHILGSSAVYVETPSGHRILYTGDVNTVQTLTLSSAELWPFRVDTLVVESTYGNRDHPPRHSVEKRFVESVEEVIDGGGVVLVPAFSVGRSQEIMALVTSELPGVKVYMDGLAKEVTSLYMSYKKFLRDPSLFARALERTEFVKSPKERKKVLKEPCVVIASAGMLKGGPSVFYLKKLHDSEKNAVFLVSYQAPNSPGHSLLESGRIEELEIGEVKARVEWFDFSSHAGKSGLLDIAKMYGPWLKNVVIVHGEPESSRLLAEAIKEELGKDVNVFVPSNGDEILLEL